MQCQQRAEPDRMDNTFGLLQLASCLLSIKERQSLRWLAHRVVLNLQAVRIHTFLMLYAHIPRFDKFRPWLSVMPVKPHPPNPYPPSWLPVPLCVGDSLNSCVPSQHLLWSQVAADFQGGTCRGSFLEYGMNARCILGDLSLDRSSAHVSHSNLRVLWCTSYVKVAKLRGAHCEVVGGCVLSTFTDFLLP